MCAFVFMDLRSLACMLLLLWVYVVLSWGYVLYCTVPYHRFSYHFISLFQLVAVVVVYFKFLYFHW